MRILSQKVRCKLYFNPSLSQTIFDPIAGINVPIFPEAKGMN